ncbi:MULTISPECIES: hypothetical protein [Pseudophaeobacter]
MARFVYRLVNRAGNNERTELRHRCHNRRCCRPDHLG